MILSALCLSGSVGVHLWFSSLPGLSAKEGVQLNLEVGQDSAGQLTAWAVNHPFVELRLTREPVQFDLLLRRQNQLDLFDYGTGVSAQL
jgi:hypothetical protein